MAPRAVRIAVIGAGLAGMRCAQLLNAVGFATFVFEKSRGAGGRLATRRADHGMRFDHGAQYLSARSDAFSSFLNGQRAAGVADIWNPRAYGPNAASMSRSPIVGAPHMNSVVKSISKGVSLKTDCRIAAIEQHENRWRLVSEAGERFEDFEVVIVATPAPQAEKLVTSWPDLAARAGAVKMTPCWTVMAGFENSLQLSFDALRQEDEALGWAARNSSKPARSSEPECWVMQASAKWSQDHLERDKNFVIDALLAMFAEATGKQLPEPSHADAHRWRYSIASNPVGESFLKLSGNGLYVGGDWLLGARAEDAFLSGSAVAEDIISNYRT
ncbi:MAG: FAD-dependent oxidoreductase [Pseudomonadota bacterium]